MEASSFSSSASASPSLVKPEARPTGTAPDTGTEPAEAKFGLSFWMKEVLREAERVSADFSTDPVHDLRVALRRCRSLAEGFQAIDPDSEWKRMRKAGRELFRSLGALRDSQVMRQWIEKLGPEGDPVRQKMLDHCAAQELALKGAASRVLQEFDRKQWLGWSRTLPRRAAHLPSGSAPFRCLALERWTEARRLQQTAFRTLRIAPLHRLRIGVKRFRYVVENFVPSLYQEWEQGLKGMQDLLGDIHDLDVLRETMAGLHVFEELAVDPQRLREEWERRIQDVRETKLQKWRNRSLGQDSVWMVWRAGLPQGGEVGEVVMKKLQAWASFLDPDPVHSRRVTRLCLQLHQGLADDEILDKETRGNRAVRLLEAAATVHEVGRSRGRAGHHKTTQRMLLKMHPPLGWKGPEWQMAALIARYHRGALPNIRQRRWRALPTALKPMVRCLAGILRLADALDRLHDGSVRRIKVSRTGGFVTIDAVGLKNEGPLGEEIAAARHLLETDRGLPILVRAT